MISEAGLYHRSSNMTISIENCAVVQFDVRQALACRSTGDKLKFVGHLFQTASLPRIDVVAVARPRGARDHFGVGSLDTFVMSDRKSAVKAGALQIRPCQRGSSPTVREGVFVRVSGRLKLAQAFKPGYACPKQKRAGFSRRQIQPDSNIQPAREGRGK
jgi:hypothetical protein